jgi:hypothetical protein
MPIKKISEPIYRKNIHFIFDTPKDKALAYLKKYFIPLNFDDHWERAGVMYGDDADYFIVLPDKKPTWTVTTIIAHEAFHAVAKIMRSKGIELCSESEEAFTYYHTWILQSFTDFYNQHYKRTKTMKAKPAKSAIKKAINQFAKKDKKEDMKMIKSAMKKGKKK